MFSTWLFCVALFILGPEEGQGENQIDEYIPCDEGWSYFGGKCYKMFGANMAAFARRNWKDASKHCESVGGHLATVQSKEVQDFLVVFVLLEGEMEAWIGLNDIKEESHYEWLDGTEFNYSDWNLLEPSGYARGNEDCVQMALQVFRGEPGKWIDLDCNYELAYICQVDKDIQNGRSLNPTLCPSAKGGGWKFGDSCYNIVEETMTWEDAEKYCQNQFKGHLLTVLNFKMDYFLKYIMADSSTDIWIGIKMKDHPQQKFSSGWYALYAEWLKTPGKFEDDTCVIRRQDKLWEVVPCSNKYPFICEVSTVSPPVFDIDLKDSKCPNVPNDWKDLGGEFCYIIDTTNRVNWYQANFECIRRGGTLASFHSKKEIDALSPYVKNELLQNYGIFIGHCRLLGYDNVFVWADGSQMDFKYWSDGEPSDVNEECGEVFATNMKWNDVRCHENKGYICSVRKTKEVQVEKQTDEYIPCDEGWLFFGGKCYKMFGANMTADGRRNWKDASKHCESAGGHLATVQSKEVQEFLVVFVLLEGEMEAWIGLNDIKDESHYEWHDGSKFNYSDWNVLEPSGYAKGNEDCVQMALHVFRGEPGKWIDLDCNYELAYICQVDKNRQNGRRSLNPTLCSYEKGGGWKYGDSCYNIVEENMVWKDAEKYCQDQFKGHLLTILNFKMDYFLKYIMADSSTDIWIGIKIKDHPQQQFSSGWYALYAEWHKRTGKYVDDTCVIRRKDKLWEVVPCSNKYPFICEVSTVSPPVFDMSVEESKCSDLPNDWKDVGGDFCYIIDTTSRVNWYQANFECIRRGGALASFHSKKEIDALAPYVKNALWQNYGIFIGHCRRLGYDNVFVWADGSQMDFKYWSDGEPSDENEECGEVFATNMKWNDVRCHENKGYICSVRKCITNQSKNCSSAS